MKKSNRKGFTIVELVIVIAVIAILAAVLIPTFTNLIKKANQSADQQAVTNMNKILKAEEAYGFKPTTPMEVLDVLRANGFSYSMKTYYEGYTLAWLSTENVVVLVKDNAVVFPKDYEGQTEYSQFIAVENNPAKLQAAISNLKPGEVLIITEDLNATSTLDFNFANEGSYALDLNGKTMISDHSIDEESSTGGTFKNVAKVSAGHVVFANGTIVADGDGTNTCLYVTEDATVTVNNMTFDNTAAAGSTCLLADYNNETLTISNTVVKGAGNAIQAYESTVILNNVTATSANTSSSAFLNSAIGIGADSISNGGTRGANVTVNGGTYTGDYFVSVFGGTNFTHTITINDGTFTGKIYDTSNLLTIIINGGTFNTNDQATIDRIKDAVQTGCTITINGESFSK